MDEIYDAASSPTLSSRKDSRHVRCPAESLEEGLRRVEGVGEKNCQVLPASQLAWSHNRKKKLHEMAGQPVVRGQFRNRRVTFRGKGAWWFGGPCHMPVVKWCTMPVTACCGVCGVCCRCFCGSLSGIMPMSAHSEDELAAPNSGADAWDDSRRRRH